MKSNTVNVKKHFCLFFEILLKKKKKKNPILYSIFNHCISNAFQKTNSAILVSNLKFKLLIRYFVIGLIKCKTFTLPILFFKLIAIHKLLMLTFPTISTSQYSYYNKKKICLRFVLIKSNFFIGIP